MRPYGSAPARVIVAFLLAVGVLGMHGLAEGTGGGCHGGAAPALSSMPPTPPMSSMDAVAAHRVTAHEAAGATCEPVLPAPVKALPAPTAHADPVAAIAAVAAPVATGTVPRDRAPPRSGRSLLTEVCIART